MERDTLEEDSVDENRVSCSRFEEVTSRVSELRPRRVLEGSGEGRYYEYQTS